MDIVTVWVRTRQKPPRRMIFFSVGAVNEEIQSTCWWYIMDYSAWSIGCHKAAWVVGWFSAWHACMLLGFRNDKNNPQVIFLESHRDLIIRKVISATVLYKVTKELMGENDHGRIGSVQIISTLEVESHYNLNIRRCWSSKFRVEFPVGAVKYMLCRLLFALSCWDY